MCTLSKTNHFIKSRQSPSNECVGKPIIQKYLSAPSQCSTMALLKQAILAIFSRESVGPGLQLSHRAGGFGWALGVVM